MQLPESVYDFYTPTYIPHFPYDYGIAQIAWQPRLSGAAMDFLRYLAERCACDLDDGAYHCHGLQRQQTCSSLDTYIEGGQLGLEARAEIVQWLDGLPWQANYIILVFNPVGVARLQGYGMPGAEG